MNKGMPNLAKRSIKALMMALGVPPCMGWVIQLIATKYAIKGTQQILIVADEAHVAILVPKNSKNWQGKLEDGIGIVDAAELAGVTLTQEEKDAIDQPAMDAFRKLAFRLRPPS